MTQRRSAWVSSVAGASRKPGYVPALARVDGARFVAVADPEPSRDARAIVGLAGGAVTTHADVTRVARRGATGRGRAGHAGGAPPRRCARGVRRRRARAAGEAPRTRRGHRSRARPRWPDRRGSRSTAASTPARAACGRQVMGRDGLELRFELAYRRRSWSPVQVHDDALLDLGPHLVDWARWLTGGELDDVCALELRPNARSSRRAPDAGSPRLVAATDARHQRAHRGAHRGAARVSRATASVAWSARCAARFPAPSIRS